MAKARGKITWRFKEGWENPYPQGARPYGDARIYEDGADAMYEFTIEWLKEHNLQHETHNVVFGLLLDNDDWQELKKEVANE